MTPKQEARLYGRAIRSRWPVSDEMKMEVLANLREIAQHGEKETARVAACNALIACERQNQQDEHSQLNQVKEQILAIAAEYGLDLADAAIEPTAGRIETEGS